MPGVRVLAVLMLGIGTVFGGMQVSMTAFTKAMGEPGLNGLMYGAFAAGNMIAGIVCGIVAWKTSPQRRLLLAYPLLVLATTPLWAAHAMVVLGAVGLVVGLCIAPSLITGYTLVEKLVPASARTEAFTWLTGAVGLGQAAGATVGGRLIDAHGASTGFLVPLGGTAAALVVLLLARKALTPRSESVVAARGVGHREPVSVD